MKKDKLKRILALMMTTLLITPTFGNSVQAEEQNSRGADYTKVDAYVLGSQMDSDYKYAGFWGLATTPYESYFSIPKNGTAEYPMTDNACLFNLISPDKLNNTPVEQQTGAWASIIAYCVDVRVDIRAEIMYRRINLEDSTYFDVESAQKIRTIVNNGITVKTAEQIQSAANEWLSKNGQKELSDVTAEEVLAAAQFAIWATANEEEIVGEPVIYNGYSPEYWDYVWNHYDDTSTKWWLDGFDNDYVFEYTVDGGAVFINSQLEEAENTKANIEALVDYYMAMPGTPANQIAVSDTSLKDVIVNYTLEDDDTYTAVVTFDVDSNLDLSTTSDLTLSVICGDTNQTYELIETGSKSFTLNGLKEKAEITVEINGYQKISDVFFFDAMGDRGTSQTLVGYDDSNLPVHAEATVGLDRVITFNKTSNGEKETYPLEGIQFDIYYLSTVDEYTAELKEILADDDTSNDTKYENPSLDLVAGKEPVATVTTDITGKAVYNLTENDQPDGIYLIAEKEHAAIVEPLSPFLIAVPMTSENGKDLIYTVNLEPKNIVVPGPDVKKDVTEIDKESDSFDVGEEHTWIIRGDIPVDMADAKEYVITDKLDYRLTYAENLVVKVEKGTDAADNVSDDNTLTAGTDYILKVSSDSVTVGDDVKEIQKFEVSLTQAGMDKVAQIADAADENETYEIRVYFNAVIDEDASVGEAIPNQAQLNYTNSVNFKYETASDKPVVYTCGINIYKHDAKDNGTALSGAVFKLARKATDEEIADDKASPLVTKDEGTVKVVYENFYASADLSGEKVNVVETTGDGKAVLYGLEEGTYYLVEIQAPEGYNLLSYPVPVKLNQNSHTDNSVVEVANSNAFKLPETGGMGTAIFTASGMMMLAAAAFVLIMSKKKVNEQV